MNSIKGLSFKTKLVSICLFISSISVVIAGLSYRGLHSVETSYDRVTEGVMPNLNLLNDMFLSYRSVRVNLRTLGLPGLPKKEADAAIEGAIAAINHYEEFNAAYQKIPFVPGEAELYDDLQKNWLHFKGIGEKALALYKTGKPEDHEKLMVIFFEDCPKAAGAYTASITKIKGFHETNGKTFVQEARSTAMSVNIFILIIAGVGIIIGLTASTIFAIKMSKSIAEVTELLSKSANQVTATSVQVASSSQQLSQAATEQAASLQQTAASLEEISSMISKASDSANVTSTSSVESQNKAQEGRTVVDKMLSSMGEISESNDAIMNQINESNQQMTEIVNVIQDIGNKTKVINEIVFQTKLLSFNASVEAARAGEHGKGFAVVAEEVGNLAQMSGNAAKEISDMLNDSIPKVEAIVEQTKTRVETLISQARLKVDSGVDVANQCSNILNAIVENVSKVSSLAKDISSAAREQTQGVTEISKAMGQLDTVTQQNTAASEETASAAQALSIQAEALKAGVHQLSVVIKGATPESATPVSAATSRSAPETPKSNIIKLDKFQKNTNATKKFSPVLKVAGDGMTPHRTDRGFEDV